jgi:hypothetical protein
LGPPKVALGILIPSDSIFLGDCIYFWNQRSLFWLSYD